MLKNVKVDDRCPCFFYVLYMEALMWYIAYAVHIAGSIGECSESTL